MRTEVITKLYNSSKGVIHKGLVVNLILKKISTCQITNYSLNMIQVKFRSKFNNRSLVRDSREPKHFGGYTNDLDLIRSRHERLFYQ